MSNETKPPVELKSAFTAPASAQECSMEDLGTHGFAAEPSPAILETRQPRPLGPGSTHGE